MNLWSVSATQMAAGQEESKADMQWVLVGWAGKVHVLSLAAAQSGVVLGDALSLQRAAPGRKQLLSSEGLTDPTHGPTDAVLAARGEEKWRELKRRWE
eukprot:1157797-Pelagomonas_calceolata.AAC.8